MTPRTLPLCLDANSSFGTLSGRISKPWKQRNGPHLAGLSEDHVRLALRATLEGLAPKMQRDLDAAAPHGESVPPFFSVVVAAYNPGERILPTIRSVLAQSYRQFELIVIGDGCSDATGEILAANFGESVHWENLDRNYGSQSYPNNAGNRLARGTHVAYLGHDDISSRNTSSDWRKSSATANPDFAVSGTVYHAPPGSRYYQFTGIFDDPSAANREFFPPSSLAHRRDVTQKIGVWRDPGDIRAPVDCEFLLRAAARRCTFASTKVITVHKFAAGHRYLFDRFPSSREQQRMLDRLLRADGDARSPARDRSRPRGRSRVPPGPLPRLQPICARPAISRGPPVQGARSLRRCSTSRRG